jgi:hypothetical protein
VSGGAIGEMAMHFIEKYGMLAVRIPSKFELRRFCRATGAAALTKLTSPSPADLGFAKKLEVQEIGGVNCLVLQQDASLGSVATVVLRGSTEGFLDDVERAIDDGVNAYKARRQRRGWGVHKWRLWGAALGGVRTPRDPPLCPAPSPTNHNPASAPTTRPHARRCARTRACWRAAARRRSRSRAASRSTAASRRGWTSTR